MTEVPFSFLDEPARYERRVVAFYDVLGWRAKIIFAGSDPAKLIALKNVIRLFASTSEPYKTKNPFSVRQSTFSDNVAVSTEASQHSVFTLLLRLAMTQFVAAQLGFWIRGGVTVGEVVHDDYVVFGPALNRAYELESQVANYPRIVLDESCFELLGGPAGLGTLISRDGNLYYLDPFTLQFAELFTSIPAESKPISAHQALALILARVMAALKDDPIDQKAAIKLNWLRDKLLPLVLSTMN